MSSFSSARVDAVYASWDKMEPFDKYYDRKINKVVEHFVRQGRLPYAEKPAKGVYSILEKSPHEEFLWSRNLSRADFKDDLSFSYGQVQGALNVIWCRIDKDLQEERKMVKGRFHDKSVARWRSFYVGRVWSLLAAIHRRIYVKAAVKESCEPKLSDKGTEQAEFAVSVMKSNDPSLNVNEQELEVVADSAAEVIVLSHADPQVAVTVELSDEQLCELRAQQVIEHYVHLPQHFSATIQIEEPDIEIATLHEVETNICDKPSPAITRKYRMRVKKLKEILGDSSLCCVCDVCAFKFVVTSKFSSVLRDVVVCEAQADDELATVRPPPNLKNKQISKIVNMIRTVRTAADRHQEKMYVLCKKGRFAMNQGDWDLSLYRRQATSMENAYRAFSFGLRSACMLDYLSVFKSGRIPWSYWKQADWLIELADKTIAKFQQNSGDCKKLLKYLSRFRDALLDIVLLLRQEFDPQRVNDECVDGEDAYFASYLDVWETRDQLEEDFEILHVTPLEVEPQMADGEPVEKPALKSAPGPASSNKDVTTKKSSGPAKKKAPTMNKKKTSASGKMSKREPKPVEKAVTKAESDKTLMLADQRTVDKMKMKKSATLKPDSNTEKNQAMDNVFKRMMFIARYKWDEAASLSEDLATFVLPGAYFNFNSKKAEKVCQPLTVNNLLSLYGFCRFDMRVRIQLNSSKMASGLLLVYWEPFCTREKANMPTSASFVNFPHVFINVCESTSAEFVVPWTNIRDYFPVYWDYNSEYNYWGMLHIRPWTPIRVGATTSADTTISVYMGFDTWEVHQQVDPKAPSAITFTQDLIPHDYPYYSIDARHPQRERYIKHREEGDNVSFAEPQMEAGVGALVGEVPEIGAIVMEQLARALSRLPCDKPLANGPPANARLEVANVPAHGDGPHTAKSLSLSAKRQTPMKSSFVSTTAPAGYKDLLEMESFVGSFTVNTSNKENDNLFSWLVTPCLSAWIRDDKSRLYSTGEGFDDSSGTWDDLDDRWFISYDQCAPTMLAYLAQGHLWWRGSLNWRFQVVKTPMHTMRIGFRYQPSGGSNNYSECQKISQPVVVWDIQESDELKLTTEYASTQPFLSTQYYGISTQYNSPSVVGNYACGTAEAFVINPLKKSTGVSDTIEVNVYISAGPDFEFAGTSDLRQLAAIGKFPLSQYKGTTVTDGQISLYLEYLTCFGLHYLNENFFNISEYESRPMLGYNTNLWTHRKDKVFDNSKLTALRSVNWSDDLKLSLRHAKEKWRVTMAKFNNRHVHIEPPEESYQSYSAAVKFLKQFSWNNHHLIKELTPAERKSLHRWLPVFHMASNMVSLNHLPSIYNLPVCISSSSEGYRSFGDILVDNMIIVEPQAEEGEELEGMTNQPPRSKGINPFTDGTSNDIARVHELFGEDFNDMYKRLRRLYCVGVWDFPKYRASDDQWYTKLQQRLIRMNPQEFDSMYWEITIPVTPQQDLGWIGDPNRFLSAANIPGKYTSTPSNITNMGIQWGADWNITPLEWISQIFTFWRGDLRMSFFFPTDIEQHAFVVHCPNDFSPFGVGINNISQIGMLMNYGTCLYKGNVQGELSVEVPWCSKYSRLLLGKYTNNAISQNGTVKLYFKVKRSEWARGLSPVVPKNIEDNDQTTDYLERVKVLFFMGLGDTAEFLVPRAAPKIYIHSKYYDNYFTDKWTVDNLDTPLVANTEIPVPFHEYDDNVRRIVQSDDVAGAHKSLFENDARYPVEGTSYITDDLDKHKGARTIRHDLHYDPPKALIAEMQGDEDIPVSKETFERFKALSADVVDGAYSLSMNEVINGVATSLAAVPIALNNFNQIAEKATKSWSIVDTTLSAVKGASDSVAHTLGVVVPKMWDATRIGLIAYAIHSFLTSETLESRMMAVMSGALAMGLDYDTVKKSVDWLLTSVTSLFTTQVNEERVEPQSEWSEEVSNFILQHSTTLKMVASAVGAFAIFSFTPHGIKDMQPAVVGFAQRMIGKIRNFIVVGSGIRTFQWLFDWIGEMFKSAFEWACDLATGGMLTRRALVNSFPDVLEWLSEIKKMTSDPEWARGVWDYEMQLRIWTLMDKGNEFSSKISKKEPFLANYISQGMRDLSELNTKTIDIKNSVPFRTDPFCIWLCGKPGVGKSAMANQLADFVGDYLDLPKTNRTWTRNEDEEYWSGYIGQPVMMVDDICQNKKGHAAAEFIRVKSNFEMQVPMADINSKGRKFRSKLIVCTSNHEYPEVEDLTHMPALWRRRNVLVRVNADEHGRKGVMYNTFDLLDPCVKGRVLVEGILYPELAARIAMECSEYLKDQEALQASNLKGMKVPKLYHAENDDEALMNHVRYHLCAISNAFAKREIPPSEAIFFIDGLDQATIDKIMDEEDRWQLSRLYTDVKKFIRKFHELKQPDEELKAKLYKNVTVAETQDEDEELQDRFNALSSTAWDGMRDKDHRYRRFKHYFKNEPKDVFWTHVANESEILAVIKETQSELTPAEQMKMCKEWVEVFNGAKNKVRGVSAIEKKTPTGFKEALKRDTFRRCFVKNSEGNWNNAFDLNDANDDTFLAGSYWETVFSQWEQQDINAFFDAMLDAKKQEVPEVKTYGVSTMVQNWIKRAQKAVDDYFVRHPYIYKIMKMGCFAAGFFLGYRLMKFICGDWVEKIENKLLEFFGMAKEHRYTQKVIEYSNNVRQRISENKLVQKITNLLKKETTLSDIEVEEAVGPAVVRAVEKIIEPQLQVVENMAKKKKSGTAAYYIGDTKKVLVTEPQGSVDPNSDLLRAKVLNNFVRIQCVKGDRLVNMLGVIVDRTYMLAPIHYFDRLAERGEMIVSYYEKGNLETHVELFAREKLRQLGGADAALYQLNNSFRPRKSIVKNFLSVEEFFKINATDAYLVTMSKTGEFWNSNVKANRRGEITYNTKLQDFNYKNLNVFAYDAATEKGDCGSLLIARNPNIARKILGIHVAGLPGKDHGFSLHVSAEELQEAISSYENDNMFCHLPDMQECVGVPVEECEDLVIPPGSFRFEGIIKKELEVKNPVKTDIRKSAIHGLVREPVTQPSILSSRDPRWNHEGTPLYNAFAKYGKESKPFYHPELKYVAEEAASDWYAWKMLMEPRVLTDHEAVFGNENIRYCDRMNLASSPGFPYVKKKGGKGKAWLYDVNAEDGIADEEYRKKYRERENLAKEGKRMAHLWVACLKDERRKMHKIRAGKTRAFLIASADWVQLFRKYFLAFCVNFYGNAGKFYSAVGVDPFSYDWTCLFRRLIEAGKNGFGIDYENFDGLTDADLMGLFCVEVNKWYRKFDPNWKPEDDIVRFVLMADTVHSCVLVGCLLLWKKNGNPSGCPITTIINTFINACYLRLAFLKIMKILKSLYLAGKIDVPDIFLVYSIWDLVLYRLGVREIVYGDDGVVAIRQWLESIFNLKTVSLVLSEHGIVSTAEDKEAELYEIQPVVNCTFLKCGFVPMKGRSSLMLAPIAEDTIFELTNWVRKSDDDIGQLRVNLYDATRFAFHHGEDFFRKFITGVNNALHARGLRSLVASYDMVREEFLEKCY